MRGGKRHETVKHYCEKKHTEEKKTDEKQTEIRQVRDEEELKNYLFIHLSEK